MTLLTIILVVIAVALFFTLGRCELELREARTELASSDSLATRWERTATDGIHLMQDMRNELHRAAETSRDDCIRMILMSQAIEHALTGDRDACFALLEEGFDVKRSDQ